MMSDYEDQNQRLQLADLLERLAKDLRSGDIKSFKIEQAAQFDRVHSGEGRGFRCIPNNKYDLKLTYERKPES